MSGRDDLTKALEEMFGTEAPKFTSEASASKLGHSAPSEDGIPQCCHEHALLYFAKRIQSGGKVAPSEVPALAAAMEGVGMPAEHIGEMVGQILSGNALVALCGLTFTPHGVILRANGEQMEVDIASAITLSAKILRHIQDMPPLLELFRTALKSD